MKIIKILILFILTFFLSCNKKEVNTAFTNVSDKNELEVAIVDFPDTISVNEIYQGNITYTSTFDTITDKLNTDGSIRRYIMLIYHLPNILDMTNKELGTKSTDTTFAYKLPDVPIRDIQFKEKGNYQLEWTIKDMIIFDTIKNRTNMEVLPMKVEETRVSKRVVVIE